MRVNPGLITHRDVVFQHAALQRFRRLVCIRQRRFASTPISRRIGLSGRIFWDMSFCVHVYRWRAVLCTLCNWPSCLRRIELVPKR